jgi:salicylate hydroxylase
MLIPRRKAKDIKLRSLYFRASLPTGTKPDSLLLGMQLIPRFHSKDRWELKAIEDGAALGVLFSNFKSTDSKLIEDRLGILENIRKNRTSIIQMISNAGQDEAAKVRESVLAYVPDGYKIPSKSSNNSPIKNAPC